MQVPNLPVPFGAQFRRITVVRPVNGFRSPQKLAIEQDTKEIPKRLLLATRLPEPPTPKIFSLPNRSLIINDSILGQRSKQGSVWHGELLATMVGS